MRLLHAADLHLGKTLHERDLFEDQSHMLDGLVAAIVAERPAALLIAGDLFDRSVPPPEALRLFDGFLNRASAIDRDLAIVVIPGNHDSAARLSFGSDLLSRAGVHIRTRPEGAVDPVIVEREGERLAVFALPFLNAGAFDSGEGLIRGQSELFTEAMRRLGPCLLPDAHNVLVAHCFAAGCSSSDSERAFVGNAELVDASLFAPFDYAALGHLHRPQKAGEKGRYPGSPLAYAFSDAAIDEPRGFLSVELARGGFEARFVPVVPLHRLVRLEGAFADLSAPGAHPEFRDDFMEVRLTDTYPVLDPADPLKVNFPNLLSVRQAAFELPPPGSGAEGATGNPNSRGGADATLADFEAFHSEVRGCPPDDETRALFIELLEEAEIASR